MRGPVRVYTFVTRLFTSGEAPAYIYWHKPRAREYGAALSPSAPSSRVFTTRNDDVPAPHLIRLRPLRINFKGPGNAASRHLENVV